MTTNQRLGIAIPAGILVLGWTATSAMALVVDPYTAGTLAGPTDYFARWADSAAAIAIGPHQVLTTNHQGGDPLNTPVVFPLGTANAGSHQMIAKVQVGGADLIVATIDGPALTQWATLYTGSVTGQTLVIGGFGPTAGALRYVNADAAGTKPLIGYNQVASTPASNNNLLLFGQNKIDSLGVDGATPTLVTDFDGPQPLPTISVGDPNRVPVSVVGSGYVPQAGSDPVAYEAHLGVGDSGGGWFVDEGGGVYKLAGLSHDAEIYNIDSNLASLFGASMQATDVTGFSTQINALIPEPATLSLLTLGIGALLRRRRI